MSSIIEPTEEQAEAMEAIKGWYERNRSTWCSRQEQSEFLLDGPAGAGKTTAAALAVKQLGLKDVVFGAYTAKAARVMQSKGMRGASTLHRLLYRPLLDKDSRVVGWTRRPDSPCLDAELIVVDEVSMCPESIAGELRSYRVPILVLGDVDGQLPPPKGAGAFVGRRPDFRLQEVYRTVAGSPINALAWRARRGVAIIQGGPEEARVAPLNAAAWAEILDGNNQVICGKNKTRQTVIRRAREIAGFAYCSLPCPGEPLVCCRNNYSQGLINGDIAILRKITEDRSDYFIAEIELNGSILVDIKIGIELFMGMEPYDITSRYALFDWSYAITCHKAQGSEWPSVVVIDDKFARWDRDLRRRWLYTAITRASERVVVFQTGA